MPELNFQAATSWSPPDHWLSLETIDAHTEGEPLRVILAGFPKLEGNTILSQRRHARQHHDMLRTALMFEPRGHADMYGCLIVPPVTAQAHFGVLFLHNEGYSTMCGHGIIAVTKIALETGLIAMQAPITTVGIDTPAGLVTAHARVCPDDDGAMGVDSVFFHNVPSFVVGLNQQVEVPGLGTVRYDLAFGGAFYAFVRAEDLGLRCNPDEYRALIQQGSAIKRAIMNTRNIQHPFEKDLGFLYGTIFTGPAENPAHHSRNVCVFAEGEVDRCPTGTGVSARTAIHHARGELAVGEPIIIESILGTSFSAMVSKTTNFGPYQAVIPEVEGRAFMTGRHRFFIDPNDPLKTGFILR